MQIYLSALRVKLSAPEGYDDYVKEMRYLR